jgi:hypothetical protein
MIIEHIAILDLLVFYSISLKWGGGTDPYIKVKPKMCLHTI